MSLHDITDAYPGLSYEIAVASIELAGATIRESIQHLYRFSDMEEIQNERLRRTLRAISLAHPFYRTISGHTASTREKSIRSTISPAAADAEGRLHRRSRGVPAAGGRPAGRFYAGRARALGHRLYDRHDQRKAFAVLQHHPRRLCDLGSGAALQRGRGRDAVRPHRQSLSARGFSDRRVSQCDPLRHDRRHPGDQRADRLGAVRVQGAAFARRGAGEGDGVQADRAVGRAELCAALSRRGESGRAGTFPPCGLSSPRASRCRRRCATS